MKKLTLFFIVWLFMPYSFYSQNDSLEFNLEYEMNKPNADYYDILKRGEEFYATYPSSIGDGPEEEFERWKNLWRNRVNTFGSTKGDFNAASIAMKSYIAGSVCNGSTIPSYWYSTGPNHMPLHTMGMISAVAALPGEPNVVYAGASNGGLFKTVDAGLSSNPTWVNLTDITRLPSGGIADIVISPLINSLGKHDLYISYGPQRFTVYSLGVLKSVDGGLTWTETGLNITTLGGYINVKKLIMDSANDQILYAATGSEVYKTTDGGTTWNSLGLKAYLTASLLSDEDINDIVIDPLNANIIYITGQKLLRYDPSLSSGSQWSIINANLSILPTSRVRISAAGSNMYALYKTAPSSQRIDISIDGGYSWSLHTNTNTYGVQFIVSSANQSIMYIGDNPGRVVNKSISGGATFTAISNYGPSFLYNGTSTHADIRALKLVNSSLTGSSDFLLAGTDGGILYSQSSSATGFPVNWVDLNGTGLNITQFSGFGGTEQNPNLLVGGTQDNDVYRYSNGVWNTNVSCDGDECTFDQASLTVFKQVDCSSGSIQISKSTNGGLSGYVSVGVPETGGGKKPMVVNRTNNKFYGAWHDLYSSPLSPFSLTIPSAKISNFTSANGVPNCNQITAFDVNEINPNVIYVGFGQPTWNVDISTCPTNCASTTPCGTICTYPASTCKVNKKFFKTTNGGVTWTDITDVGQDLVGELGGTRYAGITGVVTNPDNPAEVYVTFNGIWGSGGVGYNRVMRSLDAGNSWTDYSQGLREFPVNCIVFEKGANAAYIGTDIGVFYRKTNDPSSLWECFNQNLPVTTVIDLQINYCAGIIRAATHGRGIYESALAPIAGDINVTYSQTWDIGTYQAFRNNVIIDPGVILTVKGTATFAPGVKLIVMPNAKLIVDGGKLTNYCGAQWEGVLVGGTTSQPQTLVSGGLAAYQGIIEIKNNATIENARTAITTGLLTSSGAIDFSSFGGIIWASNSNFLNNNRDIQFLYYPNYNNKSYFKNCKFDINSSHPLALVPNSHISMWAVKNINIYGCDFSNSAYADFPTGGSGNGIYSIDSKYNVVDYCSSILHPCPSASIKRSTFDHLDYGIYSSNSDPLVNLTINHAIFTNFTYDAVHLAGVSYPSVINCSFDVGTYSYLNSGLYLDFCKYYQVQNNQFFTTSGGYIGIYVKDSKTGAHEIYRNTFTGLLAGIIALNDNSGVGNFVDGLTSHCNIFSGNQYDQGITGAAPTSMAFVQGINSGTGDPKTLVRNQYSAICGARNKFPIDFSTKPVIHACNSDASTQPLPQPSCSDLLVNVITTSTALNYASDCADKTGISRATMSAKIAEYGNTSTTLKQAYDNLIDGGNTSSLLASVNSSMSPGTLKNLLSSKSPYLSDAVLSAYLSKSSTPPNGHIKQIIIENSPVSTDVKALVDALNLPNGIQNQINNAQNGISARSAKEAQIIQANYDQKLYINDKIRDFLNDTIDPNSMDSVLFMYKTYPREDVSCDLLQVYIAKGDYVKATSIIDSLEALNQLDGYCKFQKLLLELKQAPEKCYKMETDPPTKAAVEDYANDCDKQSCPNAQALLKLVFNYQYPILRMIPETNHSMIPQLLTEATNDDSGLLSLYPNPTTDFLNIVFNNNESDIGVIEIRNVLGELIDKIQIKNAEAYLYSTQTLEQSIYFVSLYVNGKLLENKKLVLTK
jgi:Secretion system C-terminal sorting domain